MSNDPGDLAPQAGQGLPLTLVPKSQRFLNLLQHLAAQVGQGQRLTRDVLRLGDLSLRTGSRRGPSPALPPALALVVAVLLHRLRPPPPLLTRSPRPSTPLRAHPLARPRPRLRVIPAPALRAPPTRSLRGPAHPFRVHASISSAEYPPDPPHQQRTDPPTSSSACWPEGPPGSAHQRLVGQVLASTKDQRWVGQVLTSTKGSASCCSRRPRFARRAGCRSRPVARVARDIGGPRRCSGPRAVALGDPRCGLLLAALRERWLLGARGISGPRRCSGPRAVARDGPRSGSARHRRAAALLGSASCCSRRPAWIDTRRPLTPVARGRGVGDVWTQPRNSWGGAR